MNGNTSPLAFYPNRASQPFRANYRQKEIATICGSDLPPFYIYNVDADAPATCELYDANTDVKVADLSCSPHLLTHTTTIDGQSVKMWIYQGTQSGIFGNASKGYYYLKIGSYYSDIFKVGDLPSEYVKLEWQIFDDIITTDGSLISKYVVYQQVFNTILWHPEYSIEEEGKTNNGIYYAMQQTTKKTSGFSAIVNEAQCDVLSLIAPIADSIKITSCVNGQVREMRTNRFEIKSKWQSDDVTHIECEFDLLTIIRKYQKSENAPEPLPIPTPPPPPSLYVVTGSVASGTSSFTMKYGGTTYTIPCSNGQFTISYDTPFSGKVEFLTNKDKIKTLDFSQSDGLGDVTEMSFNGMSGLTSVNFNGVTFGNLTTAQNMFANTNISEIKLPNATFASCTNTNSMFYVTENTTKIEIPNATFSSVTDAAYMFCACWANTISLPNATFDTITDGTSMFSEAKLSGINMPLATFENVTNGTKMFSHNSRGDRHSQGTFNENTFPSADFSNITNGDRMFNNYKGSINLTNIDISAITNAPSMFEGADLTSSRFTSTLNNVTNGKKMFKDAKIVAAIGELWMFADDLTFGDVTDCEEMFAGFKGGGQQQQFSGQFTFASATNVYNMFANLETDEVSMTKATFASCTSANKLFYNCPNLVRIMMPDCTFASLSADNYNEPFQYCNKLERILLDEGGTMGLDSGTGIFQFAVKCPKINKSTCISILRTGKAMVSGSPDNQFKILTSVWNGFTAAEKTEIQNAKPSGWTIWTITG